MHKMQLIYLLAMVAAVPLGLAIPMIDNQDPAQIADRSTSVDFDSSSPANLEAFEYKVPADFDHEEYQNDLAQLDHSFVDAAVANDSLIEKRLSDKDKHFQIYRMRYDTIVLPCIGTCAAIPHDNLRIDSDCHGGRCTSKFFMNTNTGQNLCDREFTACGIKYKMKYTGKQGSCMRFKWFSDPGEEYWVKYAHLTRGGALVGECLVWNKVQVKKSCGLTWRMDSALKCWIHR